MSKRGGTANGTAPLPPGDGGGGKKHRPDPSSQKGPWTKNTGGGGKSSGVRIRSANNNVPCGVNEREYLKLDGPGCGEGDVRSNLVRSKNRWGPENLPLRSKSGSTQAKLSGALENQRKGKSGAGVRTGSE